MLPLTNTRLIAAEKEIADEKRSKRTLRKRIEERIGELQDEGLNCDPVKVLMEIASGHKQCPDGLYREIVGGYDEEGHPVMVDSMVRAKAASELLSYLYPKRKAVEVTGQEGKPISFAVVAEAAELPVGSSAELSTGSSSELPLGKSAPPLLIGVMPESDDPSADVK